MCIEETLAKNSFIDARSMPRRIALAPGLNHGFAFDVDLVPCMVLRQNPARFPTLARAKGYSESSRYGNLNMNCAN
jgi:hypothetical protein